MKRKEYGKYIFTWIWVKIIGTLPEILGEKYGKNVSNQKGELGFCWPVNRLAWLE